MDNGLQFVSTEFQHFLEINGVHPIMCAVFNPRENGLVECWNRTLKGGVQAFCSLGKSWEDGMLELLAQHRHMPAMPQGPSPAELLLGRRTWMAFEVMLPMGRPDEPNLVQAPLPPDTEQCLEMKAIDNSTADEMQWARLWPLFHPGELVLIRAGPVPKGLSPYRGPYEVKKALRCYTFILSDGQRWSAHRM